MNKRKYVVIATVVIMISLIPFYKFKSRMGVDILPGGHTPKVVEKLTGGLFKAKWVDRNYVRRPHIDWNKLLG